MKKTILSVLLLGALAVPTYAQSSANISVVDVVVVLNNFTEAQSYQQKFNSDVELINKQLQDKTTTGLQMQKEAEALQSNIGNPDLSQAARDLSKTQLASKIEDLKKIDAEIQTLRQSSIDSLNKQQNQIVAEEVTKIRRAVTEVAKKHNSTLVLNASGIGAVVFNDPAMDITKEVIDTLNVGAATGTAVDGGTLLPTSSSTSSPLSTGTPTLLTPSTDTGTKPLSMPPATKPAAGTTK